MTGNLNTVVKQLVDDFFQPLPALYRCIEQQCHIALEAMEALLSYLQDGNEAEIVNIETINKHRKEVNSRTYTILNRESAMPADVKAIYRAFLSLDMVINHIRISTREVNIQKLNPDEHMLQMARFLKLGIEALHQGFKKLTIKGDQVQEDAHAARSAAANTKTTFTLALADITLAAEHAKKLMNREEPMERITTADLTNLKRRMIYSSLSKTAERVTWDSEQLYSVSASYH